MTPVPKTVRNLSKHTALSLDAEMVELEEGKFGILYLELLGVNTGFVTLGDILLHDGKMFKVYTVDDSYEDTLVAAYILNNLEAIELLEETNHGA